ncbi:DUF1858 domain-containing protein [Desemzia sp. RIT804]|uniref:DUF1858 domain-containing protein n=1 Tax=Desemzia sp. RIT 804 TaxID=2810209 RepID=UPI00194F4542|nr:DUF1858 domain-containing protein [Desemzia sp. RIT 804]MBM6614757.1 DUF1858 domain-containing protein [Desemzia sp. RIT 804]
MKKINLNNTVYQLIQQYPELKNILVQLGFAPLQNEHLLNTVGRMMPLRKGAEQIGLNVSDLIVQLEKHGFTIEENAS